MISTVVPDVPGDVAKEIIFHEFAKEQLLKVALGVTEHATHADLNEVDDLIAAHEEEELNPLGLTIPGK